MVCFLAACFTKFLASRKWLPVPYLPHNQWPTPSVVPTTASLSINPSVMANFTFPFSSSSANFQPPFCSLPFSSGVAHPASSLNPILQQASTSLHPILQQASTSHPPAGVHFPGSHPPGGDFLRHRLPSRHMLCCKLMLRHILMLSLRCTPLVKSWHLLQGFLLARFGRLVHRCHFNSCQIIRQLQVWLHQVCFLPLAHTQPAAFVVGPGFLPVPGKTVTNIISGQYIDLATLLAKPSDMRSPSPLIYIDGQVVVSQASKPARA